MAMKKKPGRSKVEVGIPSTEAVFSAGNNNASGSLIANLATQNRAELAYELREIALQDIELNPDNAIFRQLDTDEDVVLAALIIAWMAMAVDSLYEIVLFIFSFF